jgi:Fis family transcriptional regulator, factor for inversion stimulation protein
VVLIKKSVEKGAAKKAARRKSAVKSGKHPEVQLRNRPLRSLTEEALNKYFKDLNGHKPTNLYEFVLSEVEAPLLISVMKYTDGNQTIASDMLGINRATLRKKLKQYSLI